MLFLWQLAQGVVAWAPESGKTAEWLNVACDQSVSENLWQVSQVVGKVAWGTGDVAVW